MAAVTSNATPSSQENAWTSLHARLDAHWSAADWKRMQQFVQRAADPDAALLAFDRWLEQADIATLPRHSAADAAGLGQLLQLFGSCHYHAEWILRHYTDFRTLQTELLETPPRAPAQLLAELQPDIDAADDIRLRRALRRVQTRETVRILALDMIQEAALDKITGLISDLADAMLEAALRGAIRLRFGKTLAPELGILALGKLGGRELNYSSDIDIMFVYAGNAVDAAAPGREAWTEVAAMLTRCLNDNTPDGHCYRVDTRLRPDGANGALLRTLDSYKSYYLERGRPWERQMLIKARAAAGLTWLGGELLDALQPFIYAPRVELASIRSIQELKRRIEARTAARGESWREIKTGFGGIRDIEFTVQFLQLLHVRAYPQLHTGGTLEALRRLEHANALTHREAVILRDAYVFLRRVEHRLQTRNHLQTHVLPEADAELLVLARDMGFHRNGMQRFFRELERHTREVRKTLERVLHQAFRASDTDGVELEWLLGAEADHAGIANALREVGFHDSEKARQLLWSMAEERSPYVAPNPQIRRYFADIAAPMLRRLRATNNPDEALLSLERCVESLGGKATLYRLFAENRQALDIFVDLAMWSPPLVQLITREPGILDQVMDSLMVGRHKDRVLLSQELLDMRRGFDTLPAALNAFKNQELLRIGIRDLQQQAPIHDIMRELSDLAETILDVTYREHAQALAKSYDAPACGFVILGLGKLGGREINYQSDLDVMFIYERENGARDHREYFGRLARTILATLTEPGPTGEVYAIDARLRPQGKSGPLVTSLEGFENYHAASAQLWEKQLLLRARVCAGDAEFGARLLTRIQEILAHITPDEAAIRTEIAAMRGRIEAGHPRHLKKGPGGLLDIEFIVQCLQLIGNRRGMRLWEPNTPAALTGLVEAKLLTRDDAAALGHNYRFLRQVENRIRIASALPMDALPDAGEAADLLAARLGDPVGGGGAALLAELARVQASNRMLLHRLVSVPKAADVTSIRQEGLPGDL